MRVLWISHFVPYPPRGGSMQRSFNLIREASKSVEIHFSGVSLLAQQPDAQAVERARSELAKSCASVEIVPAPFLSSRAGKVITGLRALVRGRSYSETWLDTAAIRAQYAAAIERVRPDVIHVDSSQIADMLPESERTPAVVTHHNVESHMMERRLEHASGPMRWFLDREASKLADLETRAAARYARHLMVSSLDAERFRERIPGVVCDVVANGVDPDYFAPSDVTEEPDSLVFAGRMNQYPNEQAMLRFIDELLPAIRSRRAETRLVVAGMNPTPALQAAAGGLDHVTVTGAVDDIRPWIAGSAVYVCPMLDGGGTRLKVLDAMALARPIVATPLAMEGIEVANGDQVAMADFGEPFVEAVVDLLGDETRRASLARRAREWTIATYAWESIGKKLVESYRAAAG